MIQLTAGTQRALKPVGTIASAAGRPAVTCGSSELEASQHSCMQTHCAVMGMAGSPGFCVVFSFAVCMMGLWLGVQMYASINIAPSLGECFDFPEECDRLLHYVSSLELLLQSSYPAAKSGLLTQIKKREKRKQIALFELKTPS